MTEVAPDGSPIEMYTRMPTFGDGDRPRGDPGAFEEVVHHLTIADGAPDEVLDSIARDVAVSLPLVQRVDSVTLAARRSGTWSVVARYPLGTIGDDA